MVTVPPKVLVTVSPRVYVDRRDMYHMRSASRRTRLRLSPQRHNQQDQPLKKCNSVNILSYTMRAEDLTDSYMNISR